MCAASFGSSVPVGSIYDDVLIIPDKRQITDHCLAALLYATDLYSVVESANDFDLAGMEDDTTVTELVHQLSNIRREIKFIEQLLLPF